MATFKICTSCKLEKPLEDFYKRPNHLNSYRGVCKSCAAKERKAKWNKDYQSHVNSYSNNRRLERKLWAINYLGGKCSKCEQSYPHYVYDFHHVDPNTKDKGIANLLTLSFVKLEDELKKCVLLCANCHREEHYGDLP